MIIESYEVRSLSLMYQELTQVQKQIQELQRRQAECTADLTGLVRKLSGDDTITLDTHNVELNAEARTLTVTAK